MKKLICLFILLLLVAVCFAACGQSNESNETEEPTETKSDATESETESSTDPGEGTVTPSYTPGLGMVSYDDQNIQTAEWKMESGLYKQIYKVNPTTGTRTTFQASVSYAPVHAIPTDSVMVYGDSASAFKAWDGSGAYTIDMMIAINRASLSYVEQDKDRAKDIQTTASGDYLVHSTGGAYYMVPTPRWTEYIWKMLDGIAKTYHPDMIAVEEPEMWHSSGYSEGFKAEWKTYYGEDWQDPASSPEAGFKSMRLKTYLFERLLKDISERMKKNYPDIKLVIATHSTVNYNAWSITAGVNHYLALGVLSGVIGQTWSDTVRSTFQYAGYSMRDEYANAYVEYISYVDSVSHELFYALADPMSDGGYPEEEARFMYRQTLAAQLMVPEIQRFEVLPWVNRAFTSVSADYKSIQMGIYNMLNDLSGKDVRIEAGTPGITYLLSDSVSWIQTGNDWANPSSAGVYGLTMPLVYSGIPVKMAAMDQLTDPQQLSNVSVLIVSYDNQLPDREEINQAIADWVKKGGTVLVATGHTAYWDMQGQSWSEAGSPLNDLINRLGLSGLKVKTDTISGVLHWDAETSFDLPDKKLLYVYGNYTNTFEGQTKTVMTFDGKAVAIDEAVGEGHIIICGLPSSYFTSSVFAADLLRALTEYALKYTPFKFVETNLVTARRGNYVLAHALDSFDTVEGKYIDLFTPQLKIKEDVDISGGDSAILLDISGLDLSVPRLAFTQGTLTGDVEESSEKTVFSIHGPDGTILNSRLIAPNGLYPQTVTASKGGASVVVNKEWDAQTNSLLVYISATVEPTTVTVTWGTTKPEGSDTKWTYVSETIQTNNKNLDQDYIYESTAASNDSLKYCDQNRYIIYKFDSTGLHDAQYTFLVFQNYIVEVSEDATNWQMIADYSEGGKVPHLTTGGNDYSLMVAPSAYGFEGVWYFRLRNCRPSQGWGGSIKNFTIRYAVPAEGGDDPGQEEDTVDYDHWKLDPIRDQEDTLIKDKAGQRYSYTIKTNQDGNDLAYLIFNSAGANSNIRYCDRAGQLIYAYDISNMKDADFSLRVSQNYIVEVSDNGEDWFLIADYSQGGTVPHLTTGQNGTTLHITPDDFGFGELMYIRIRNTDISKGWGGSISEIIWSYTAIETLTYAPN